ncbi:hypothetical protein AURDEDRAFT_162175 [Auricularia subglabra TFB-10046 SS5]|nr:hypothetical protein AURDEDRAFT_162175 [Auricularia subglabra TFB-10046 SS5]
MARCHYHDPELGERCPCTQFLPHPNNPRQCWDCRHFLTVHQDSATSAKTGSTKLLSTPSGPKDPFVLDIVRRGKAAGGLQPADSRPSERPPERAIGSSSQSLHQHKVDSVEDALTGFRKKEADIVARGAAKKKKKRGASGSGSSSVATQTQKDEGTPVSLLIMLDCGASSLTPPMLKPDPDDVQQYIKKKLALRAQDKTLRFDKHSDYDQVSSWLCEKLPAAAALIAAAAEEVPDECPLVLLYRKDRKLRVWKCTEAAPARNDLELAKGNITQSYKNHEIWFSTRAHSPVSYRRNPTDDKIALAEENGTLKGKKRARSQSVDSDMSTESGSDSSASAPTRRAQPERRTKCGKSESTTIDPGPDDAVQQPATPLFIGSTPSSPRASPRARAKTPQGGVTGFEDFTLGLDGFELAEHQELLDDPEADLSDDEPTAGQVVNATAPATSADMRLTTPPPPAVGPVVSPPKMKNDWAQRFLNRVR